MHNAPCFARSMAIPGHSLAPEHACQQGSTASCAGKNGALCMRSPPNCVEGINVFAPASRSHIPYIRYLPSWHDAMICDMTLCLHRSSRTNCRLSPIALSYAPAYTTRYRYRQRRCRYRDLTNGDSPPFAKEPAALMLLFDTTCRHIRDSERAESRRACQRTATAQCHRNVYKYALVFL